MGFAGCSASGGNGSSGWFQQDIGPINPLFGVSFVDANVGTVVGFETILRTTDGGATWEEQYPGFGRQILIDVSFTDANTGTAVGDRGTILRTTDGGVTWVQQDSGTTSTLISVSFTDASNGTAVGSQGTILRTTDGGQTWVSQRSREGEEIDGVSFTDAETGTAVGFALVEEEPRPLMLRTTNGGATWIEQETGLGSANGSLRDVSFVDASTGTVIGWAEGRPVILRTTDGGVTWIEQDSGLVEQDSAANPPLFFSSVCFTDRNNGTIVGNDGTILRTRDGGTTWIEQDSGSTSSLSAVSFTDADNGTVVGGATILRTTGGGWGPFIETEPYCEDKPDDTPCVARDGWVGNCASGVCCYDVRDPFTGEIVESGCDEPGTGGSGGTSGSGGAGGGGAGGAGAGGVGGSGGACVNQQDAQTYSELAYTDGAGIARSGDEAAFAISGDCVFGALASDPRNFGCPAEAQAVLICASAGCPPETVEALATCVVECTQDIIEQQTGSMLTGDCASCYGDSTACTAALCATAGCSDRTSPSCIQCRCENDCTPGFDLCSGLPSSGECDR